MYSVKRIYLPANAPAQATYAADELRYYIALPRPVRGHGGRCDPGAND